MKAGTTIIKRHEKPPGGLYYQGHFNAFEEGIKWLESGLKR
tara:strand:- start:51 stop:173 length:123 start_codon:yes stop_codon:yes gene_type:complete